MRKKTFRLLCLPSVDNMEQIVDKFSFPIELTKGRYQDLEYIFQDGQVTIEHKGEDLRNFSFVWLCSSWEFRDLAYAVQLFLDQSGVPNTRVEKGTSKLTDHVTFSLNGVPSPNTLFFGRKNIKKSLEQINKVCGYPLVIKDVKGSRGTHSVKVTTEKELLKKMKDLPKHKKFLFQQYISNKFDWGVIVANGVVVSGERRYSCAGDFRNNVCKGGTVVSIDPVDIPELIKKTVLAASEAVGLAWSRPDVVIDEKTGKPYVLEVNRFPGVTSKSVEVDGGYEFLFSQIKHLARSY